MAEWGGMRKSKEKIIASYIYTRMLLQEHDV